MAGSGAVDVVTGEGVARTGSVWIRNVLGFSGNDDGAIVKGAGDGGLAGVSRLNAGC